MFGQVLMNFSNCIVRLEEVVVFLSPPPPNPSYSLSLNEGMRSSFRNTTVQLEKMRFFSRYVNI